MRIDLNQGTQAVPESNRTSGEGSSAAGATAASHGLGEVLGQDQAQLSGAHVQVEALAAQAAQLPEAREERVAALRQAVTSGQYHPDPEQVAGAVFEHMIAPAAA